MASNKDSIKKTGHRKERVDKTIFDTSFFDDSKIQEIEFLFGDAAPAYYQLIAFQILKEGGPIRFNGAIAILQKKQIGEQAEKFLNSCIEIGLFYRCGHLISSSRADHEIETLVEKRESWRKRQGKTRESRQQSSDSYSNTQSITTESSNSHPNVTRDTTFCHSNSEEEQEEEKEEERELGSGEVQEGGRELDPEIAKFLPMADAALRPETGSEVMIAPGFISAGRRPIKKYPNLWITPHKLAGVFAACLEAGVPPDRMRLVFTPAEAHGETKMARGQHPSLFNAEGWLLGFGLNEALKQLTIENHHKHSLAKQEGRR